jgi:hypothetical protein
MASTGNQVQGNTAQQVDSTRTTIRFEDAAQRAGIKHTWKVKPRPMRVLEAFGAGCAFLDYDNDGWQDILLVDQPHAVLYRNRGDGTFEDVTARTGLDRARGYWAGCATGDYDGDGRIDLVLTGFHALAMLRNTATRWQDVTREVGLDPQDSNDWGSSAALMDLDGNNTLDLVVGHYVVFGPRVQPQYCYLGPKKIKSGCPPQRYKPEFVRIWRNEGGRKFRDVTAQSGLNKTHGKALVLAFADIDNNNRIDFYVGNDGVPADLMRNEGNLKFRNIGTQSGTAFGVRPGLAMAAMGADWADYDGDGLLDLAVSGFSQESYSLLRNMGEGAFEQNSATSGIAGVTLKPLGFGTKWFDVENDGWPDLLFVNGHVYDTATHISELSSPLRQPSILFQNVAGYLGDRSFKDVTALAGEPLKRPILGRGLATGDYDNDGRMDALIVDYEGAPILLHNVSTTPHHWISFQLRGRGANRFAHGAKITARAGKRIWTGCVAAASSYLSSSDIRVHFGLGETSRLESLTINWPDGTRSSFVNVEANRIVTIQQGQGIVASSAVNSS